MGGKELNSGVNGIRVREIGRDAPVRDWFKVSRTVFEGDSSWIEQLEILERRRIKRSTNPFFGYGKAAFFIAYRHDRPVGRIAAILNPRYIERHHPTTGHFGFFECIDDQSVAEELVNATATWLKAQGMTRMLGPFSLTINEESGLLVSGFDTGPAMLMNHARRWFGPCLEGCGFRKVVDLYAYRMNPAKVVPEVDRLARIAIDSQRVRIRQLDLRNYRRESALIFDIFNDAWADNWGFIPFSDEDIVFVSRELRPLMIARSGRIAEIDGEPAAMMIVLPDINDIMSDFGGRLLPFNWAKLVYARYKQAWRTARIPLLGIRREYQGSVLAMAVLSRMTSELMALNRQYNLDWVEFSWVLETNKGMTQLAELASGPPIKTYRMYEKTL